MCDFLFYQLLQVKAELVAQFLLNPALVEERSEPKGQLVEPAHQDLPDPFFTGPAYSYLKATMGSTLVARQAGIVQASTATQASRNETDTSVVQSVGLML